MNRLRQQRLDGLVGASTAPQWGPGAGSGRLAGRIHLPTDSYKDESEEFSPERGAGGGGGFEDGSSTNEPVGPLRSGSASMLRRGAARDGISAPGSRNNSPQGSRSSSATAGDNALSAWRQQALLQQKRLREGGAASSFSDSGEGGQPRAPSSASSGGRLEPDGSIVVCGALLFPPGYREGGAVAGAGGLPPSSSRSVSVNHTPLSAGLVAHKWCMAPPSSPPSGSVGSLNSSSLAAESYYESKLAGFASTSGPRGTQPVDSAPHQLAGATAERDQHGPTNNVCAQAHRGLDPATPAYQGHVSSTITPRFSCASSLQRHLLAVQREQAAWSVVGGTPSIADLLRNIGLQQYLPRFLEEEVTELALLSRMAREDRKELKNTLAELGVSKIGHREKIVRALLEAEAEPQGGGEDSTPEPGKPKAAQSHKRKTKGKAGKENAEPPEGKRPSKRDSSMRRSLKNHPETPSSSTTTTTPPFRSDVGKSSTGSLIKQQRAGRTRGEQLPSPLSAAALLHSLTVSMRREQEARRLAAQRLEMHVRRAAGQLVRLLVRGRKERAELSMRGRLLLHDASAKRGEVPPRQQPQPKVVRHNFRLAAVVHGFRLRTELYRRLGLKNV
jgi:hypothetical protein